MKKLIVLLPLFAVSFCCKAETNTKAPLLMLSSNSNTRNILIVSNNTFLKFDDCIVVNLSPVDWAKVTNAYPKNINTNSVTFWK